MTAGDLVKGSHFKWSESDTTSVCEKVNDKGSMVEIIWRYSDETQLRSSVVDKKQDVYL